MCKKNDILFGFMRKVSHFCIKDAQFLHKVIKFLIKVRHFFMENEVIKTPETAERVVKNVISNRLMKYGSDKACSLIDAKDRLASHCGVGKNQVTIWVNNRAQPSLEMALIIAEFFNLPIEQIFTITKK